MYNEIGMRQLVSAVRLVDVVIGKTNDKQAITNALTAIGYSKIISTAIKKLRIDNLIVLTTHLERAEFIVDRIRSCGLRSWII